jgi:hypothetical protein
VRKYTRDRAVIRRWAEERGAIPARVRGAGIPRFAFGELPPNWEARSWDEFLDDLAAADLVFFYEESAGSRICKFVKGHTIDD